MARRTELEVVTGTVPGEAVVSMTPRGRGTPVSPTSAPPARRAREAGAASGRRACLVRGRTYRISAGVFWQVHTGAAAALLHAVLALAGDCRGARIVDLYAGAGLFSVPLAEAAGPTGSVLAIERDTRACADARAQRRRAHQSGGHPGRGDTPARGDRTGPTPTSSCSTRPTRAPARR